jgi:hypothetical protein
MEQTVLIPRLRLQAHLAYSYVPRTKENAHGADVTVAFAVDFNTGGERLTRAEAGPRYVGIPFGGDVAAAAEKLAAFIIKREGSTLNVAGNGIYTLAEHGVSQARANKWVFDVLSLVVKQVKLTDIRSGGQTGIDQAGLVAALVLGIPALGLYPKSFRRRNVKGEEFTSTESAVRKELEQAAAALSLAPRRMFHVEGTLPLALEDWVFVFGSNLAGRHGRGAAAIAASKFGAKRGVGMGGAEIAADEFGAQKGTGPGRQGQSYGIPTKDGRPLPGNPRPRLDDPAQTLPLDVIKRFVDDFIAYATAHPEMRFFVTRIGCGLAGYKDEDIAPLFTSAPANCSLPDTWKPLLAGDEPKPAVAEPVNIWSGAHGLGGALTNMSERAREKGCIKNPYPVKVNGATYPDSEAAYQALKVQGEEDYNDCLMIDLIALKFVQNQVLFERTTRNGGVAWLEKCSHFTQAKTERAQSWEGQGSGSRFIRNLIHGYVKAMTGVGPKTHVVHVKHAPYDEYIGRRMGADFPESLLHNPHRGEEVGSVVTACELFYARLKSSPELMAKARSLKGKTVGCWCKDRGDIHQPCHGEVVAAVADGREWVAPQVAQGSLF